MVDIECKNNKNIQKTYDFISKYSKKLKIFFLKKKLEFFK